MKILVVDKAKKEIEKLQHFVNLAESYQPITIEQMAIHQYAYLGSVKKEEKLSRVIFLISLKEDLKMSSILS